MRKQFGDRLKELRSEKQLTQEQLAKIFNTGKASISNYESNRRIPDPYLVEKYADFFEVSIDYMLGKTDMRNDEDILKKLGAIPVGPMVKVPIVGTVRAGLGGVAVEDFIGYEFTTVPNCDKDSCFYLQVKGNSMEPRISEGDLALVKRQSDVNNGELAIVIVDNEEGVIKKVFKKENCIELHSFNLYYPPRIFTGENLQYIKIIGKVIETKKVW